MQRYLNNANLAATPVNIGVTSGLRKAFGRGASLGPWLAKVLRACCTPWATHEMQKLTFGQLDHNTASICWLFASIALAPVGARCSRGCFSRWSTVGAHTAGNVAPQLVMAITDEMPLTKTRSYPGTLVSAGPPAANILGELPLPMLFGA